MFKNGLFDATNAVKNEIKVSISIAAMEQPLLEQSNGGFVMNLFKMLLIISSSFHTDYLEHKCWVLGNGSTDDDSAAWAAKQNFSVNFSNVKTHVCYFFAL